MSRTKVTLAIAACALLVAGCSSTGSSATAVAGGPTSPAGAASNAPSAPTAPTAPATSSPDVSVSGVATSLDPCQIVTSAEASALAHTTYGPGKEEVNEPNDPSSGKTCTYGAQTTNVFHVVVGQASDQGAADAAFDQAQAKAKAQAAAQLPPGTTFQITPVSGLGDRAATVYSASTLGGKSFGISAIYVLSGTTFFTFSDLVVGQAPPSAADLTAQAQTSLSRIG